jgi:hypothetical protein
MEVKHELFETYAFYMALLLAKVVIMSPLTTRQRFSKKVIWKK